MMLPYACLQTGSLRFVIFLDASDRVLSVEIVCLNIAVCQTRFLVTIILLCQICTETGGASMNQFVEAT